MAGPVCPFNLNFWQQLECRVLFQMTIQLNFVEIKNMSLMRDSLDDTTQE